MTVRYQLILVWMAIIKMATHKRNRGCGETGALLHCGRECKLVQLLWKTVWSTQKAKNRVAIQSWSPTPGRIFRQNSNPKRYMHPNVHCSTFHNTRNVEATYMSIARWRKMWYMYTMEYYSALRNETIPFGPTWMDAEIIILNEGSQKERTNTIWHRLYVESKMWHKWIYKMETNSQT